MDSTLITTNKLKEFTSISDNIDVNLLQPHLLIAQQLYIQPILGDALYTSILAQFDNQTLSGDTLTLYDEYITPAIGFSAWFSAAPFLLYKTQRQGIQTQNGDNSTPLTSDEFSLYSARVENFKNFYCDRLLKYLEDNYDKFPLFRNSSTSDNVNHNVGGIYLNYKKYDRSSCNGW